MSNAFLFSFSSSFSILFVCLESSSLKRCVLACTCLCECACVCMFNQTIFPLLRYLNRRNISVPVRVRIDLLANDLFRSFNSTIALVRFALISIVSRISCHPRENRPFRFWEKFVCAVRYSEGNGILLKNHSVEGASARSIYLWVWVYIFIRVQYIPRVCPFICRSTCTCLCIRELYVVNRYA